MALGRDGRLRSLLLHAGRRRLLVFRLEGRKGNAKIASLKLLQPSSRNGWEFFPAVFFFASYGKRKAAGSVSCCTTSAGRGFFPTFSWFQQQFVLVAVWRKDDSRQAVCSFLFL